MTIHLSGICRACGCSDEHGCNGGCWWIDEDQTLCSACLPRLDNDALFPLYRAEVERLVECEVALPIDLDVPSALMLVGLLNVVLRHPEIPANPARVARTLVDGLRSRFAEMGCPVISEVHRRGDDRSFDGPFQTPSQEYFGTEATDDALDQ